MALESFYFILTKNLTVTQVPELPAEANESNVSVVKMVGAPFEYHIYWVDGKPSDITGERQQGVLAVVDYIVAHVDPDVREAAIKMRTAVIFSKDW